MTNGEKRTAAAVMLGVCQLFLKRVLWSDAPRVLGRRAMGKEPFGSCPSACVKGSRLWQPEALSSYLQVKGGSWSSPHKHRCK